MSAARAELWRRAAALSAAAGPDLSARARRLAVRDDPALSLEDIQATPDWMALQPGARDALVRLTGAAAVSHAWRRTIDGATLRAAGEALGEATLDALLALPDVLAPQVDDRDAEAAGPQALDRLGGALLLAEGGFAKSLAPRLARALPGAAADAPTFPADTAAAARRTAEAVQAQVAAGGAS